MMATSPPRYHTRKGRKRFLSFWRHTKRAAEAAEKAEFLFEVTGVNVRRCLHGRLVVRVVAAVPPVATRARRAGLARVLLGELREAT